MSTRKLSFDRVLLYALTVVVVSLSLLLVRKEFFAKETAYVDVGKLLQQYEFKKSLEQSTSTNLYRIKDVIDSLSMIKKAAGHQPVSQVDSQLRYAEAAFENYYAQTNKEITQKVWERLNPLMIKYGEERDIKILLGATGTGNLLYADKQSDVTDDLINYVNRHYEKGN